MPFSNLLLLCYIIPMKNILSKFTLFLQKKYNLTPVAFSYIRIFAAPWLALLISKILDSKSLKLGVIALVLYFLVIATHWLRKSLIHSTENYSDNEGDKLDLLSDKIFIIFILIPFGFNLFTFLIILAESILAFQAIHSPHHINETKNTEKIKIVLQAFLIPVLILQLVTNLIPDMLVYVYIILAILATYVSLFKHFSHYFYVKK